MKLCKTNSHIVRIVCDKIQSRFKSATLFAALFLWVGTSKTWPFLMWTVSDVLGIWSKVWPAACKITTTKILQMHDKPEKNQAVSSLDCIPVWLWWVLHAWLSVDMSPLVPRPVWYAPSSARATTWLPVWAQIWSPESSDLCLPKDPLGSTNPGVESILGHFWTAYVPQMEFHLFRILCGKLHNSNALSLVN